MMSDHEKLSPELMRRARNTNSAEELLALAKENNIIMTLEEAQQSFEQLHTRSKGEITEEELDNVVGGVCYMETGELVVTLLYSCDYYEKIDNAPFSGCCHCRYKDSEGVRIYCTHPANYKK